ncbi:MAG: polysaccharide deacetylase family protein [Pseudomonadota bacterium]
MSPNSAPALCVEIHDVAPATWSECLHLLHAVRAVADIPLSWLVVPRYHGSEQRSLACEATLGRLLSEGHELVLHGYTHHDAAPSGGSLASRFLRGVYTEREGEFSALGAGEARRRIELGLAWFAERGWPVSGFVAPAWLLGREVWPLLAGYGFTYTVTMPRFHLLDPARSVFAPALTYAARNRAGRMVSPCVASLAAALAGGAPLLRLALHPRDAHHPALVRHAQRLIARLLVTRDALTTAEFARRLAGLPTSADPTRLQGPNASDHSRRSSSDSHSAARPPWR